MIIAIYNLMKKIILNIIFITAIIFFSCKEENKVEISKNDTLFNSPKDQKEIVKDTQINNSIPDYVPPQKKGGNKYWYYNKNRKLMNDSNCSFGKGMRHRHRHRWGWGRNQQN